MFWHWLEQPGDSECSGEPRQRATLSCLQVDTHYAHCTKRLQLPSLPSAQRISFPQHGSERHRAQLRILRMDCRRNAASTQAASSHLMYMCCDSTGLQKLCMPPHTHAALALSDTLMLQHTLYLGAPLGCVRRQRRYTEAAGTSTERFEQGMTAPQCTMSPSHDVNSECIFWECGCCFPAPADTARSIGRLLY